MRRVSLLVLCLGLTISAQAKIQTKTIEYKDKDATLEGYVAYDDAGTGKRPGVLIVHAWKGLGDYEKKRAEQLAGLGYVAFAVDIYGKGIRPQSTQDAARQAGMYKGNRPLLRERATAGLEVLKSQELVDPKKIAAIGYCFGGTTVLELARMGADIAGVVSFHGGLDAPMPAEPGAVKCKVLVQTGADDPSVPPKAVEAFQDEMRKAGADWGLVSFGNAVHSFTNPEAGNDNSKGNAYNEKADKRSWENMKGFFAEIFK